MVNLRSEYMVMLPYVKDIPFNLCHKAMAEFMIAYTTNMAKLKAKKEEGNNQWTFTMKKRCKKDHQQSMAICHKYYKEGWPYTGTWKHIDFKTGTVTKLPPIKSLNYNILSKLEHDSRIVLNKGWFYLAIPVEMTI